MRRLALLIVGLGVCGCGGPTSPTDLAFVRYALPINLSEIDPASPLKLWPYGVQGGSHPNGHPGIDFFLVVGGSVLADQKGMIIDVANSVSPGEIGITLRHDDGWKSYFTGYYTSVAVSKGQSVSQGQVLGRIARFGFAGDGLASFHWGIARNDSAEQVSCPVEFVSPDTRATMQKLLNESTYVEKARFPLLCNPCPAGGCR